MVRFKTFFENDMLETQFIATFMDSRCQDLASLSAYSDHLNERDHPMSQAINLILTGKQDHEAFHTIVHADHIRPDHTRTWTLSGLHDKTKVYYAATFHLNDDASAESRYQHVRNRFWQVNVPAGGELYRMTTPTYVLERYVRPLKSPRGVPAKTQFAFSRNAIPDLSTVSHNDFKPVKYLELPPVIGYHFFVVALIELYWGKQNL